MALPSYVTRKLTGPARETCAKNGRCSRSAAVPTVPSQACNVVLHILCAWRLVVLVLYKSRDHGFHLGVVGAVLAPSLSEALIWNFRGLQLLGFSFQTQTLNMHARTFKLGLEQERQPLSSSVQRAPGLVISRDPFEVLLMRD